MARVEQAIYNILSNDAIVTALTSSRIYPSVVPQDKGLPAITYERISSMRHYAMGTDPGVSETVLEITAISTSVSTVGDLSNRIRESLSRNTGSHASINIIDIYIDNESQTYFSDLETYEIISQYVILHDDTT